VTCAVAARIVHIDGTDRWLDEDLATSATDSVDGRSAKLALISAMRKLLHAVHSVTRNRKPFTLREQGRPA
jgi:hypothetical protein